jgi:hypothetical protein
MAVFMDGIWFWLNSIGSAKWIFNTLSEDGLKCYTTFVVFGFEAFQPPDFTVKIQLLKKTPRPFFEADSITRCRTVSARINILFCSR